MAPYFPQNVLMEDFVRAFRKSISLISIRSPFSITYLAPSRTVVHFVSYNFSCQNLCPGTDTFILLSCQFHNTIIGFAAPDNLPLTLLSQNCLRDCSLLLLQRLMCKKSSKAGWRPAWLSKDLLLKLRSEKKMHSQWKQGVLT